MYVFKVVHFGGLLDFAHNMPCCVGAFLSTMAKQIVNLLITGPFGFFAHCPLNTCHLIVSSYQMGGNKQIDNLLVTGLECFDTILFQTLRK